MGRCHAGSDHRSFVTVGSHACPHSVVHADRLQLYQQNYKVTESKRLTFTANFHNLLNQRAVTAYNADITSLAIGNQYATLNSDRWTHNHLRIWQPVLHRRRWPLLRGSRASVQRSGPAEQLQEHVAFRRLSTARTTRRSTTSCARNIRLGVKFTF